MEYKSNYLTEVIFRLDFAAPVESIQKQTNKELTKSILKNFPIQEIQDIPINDFVLNHDGSASVSKIMTKEFRYFAKNREKYLQLSNDFFVISFREYKSFTDFKEKVISVIDTLFQSNVQVRRMGMRFINQIKSNENPTDPTNWSGLICDNLIRNIEFHDTKSEYSRILTTLEFNFEDFNLRFQHGIINQNYPGKIKEKLFLLDFDAYSEGYYETKDEITTFMEKAHNSIVNMFENSIEENLRRELLNDGEN
jgi:uncharacterized protein (TIGR04255 family)